MNEIAMHLAINMPLIQHIVSSLMYHKGLKSKDSYPIAIVKVWIWVICSWQPYSCYKLEMFPKQWRLEAENNNTCSRNRESFTFQERKQHSFYSSSRMPIFLKMSIPVMYYKYKQWFSLLSILSGLQWIYIWNTLLSI